MPKRGPRPRTHRQRSGPRGFWLALWRACKSSHQHNILGAAKGAAYSGLLAFIPVFTTIVTLLVHANAEETARRIVSMLLAVVPPGSEEVVRANILQRGILQSGMKPIGVPISAVLLAVWAAGGLVISLIQGFQLAAEVPNPRTWWGQRLVSMVLAIALAVPIVGGSSLILFQERLQSTILVQLGVLGQSEEVRGLSLLLGRLISYLTALSAVVAAMMMLYRYGPGVPGPKRVLPGATVATLFWLIATILFGWYTRNISNYNVLYSGIGAGIALVLWMYILSLIALYGYEFNVQRDRLGL